MSQKSTGMARVEWGIAVRIALSLWSTTSRMYGFKYSFKLPRFVFSTVICFRTGYWHYILSAYEAVFARLHFPLNTNYKLTLFTWHSAAINTTVTSIHKRTCFIIYLFIFIPQCLSHQSHNKRFSPLGLGTDQKSSIPISFTNERSNGKDTQLHQQTAAKAGTIGKPTSSNYQK